MMVDISWLLMGSSGYILAVGGWCWMVVDIFCCRRVVLDGGGYILASGGWWWVVVDIFWQVADGGGWWHSLV